MKYIAILILTIVMTSTAVAMVLSVLSLRSRDVVKLGCSGSIQLVASNVGRSIPFELCRFSEYS